MEHEYTINNATTCDFYAIVQNPVPECLLLGGTIGEGAVGEGVVGEGAVGEGELTRPKNCRFHSLQIRSTSLSTSTLESSMATMSTDDRTRSSCS